jgi:hypothetical protein
MAFLESINDALPFTHYHCTTYHNSSSMSFLGNNKLKKMKQKSFSESQHYYAIESQHYYAIDGARDPALSDSKLIKDSDCMGGSTEV